MSRNYLLMILCFHSLAFSMKEESNKRLDHYNSLTNPGNASSMTRYIAVHNTRLASEGTLKGNEFLIETDVLLRFIEKHVREINPFNVMKEFFHINSLIDYDKNPLFLNKKTLSRVFSIFHKNNVLTKKNDIISLLSLMEDPLLFNRLIYKNDILKYLYSVPKKKLPCNSDIIKKGLEIGVETSIKIFNVFRKKDNPINSTSDTVINNRVLLPRLLKNCYKGSLIFDNVRFASAEMNQEKQKASQIKFLKIMLQPHSCKKLTQYKLLPNDAQKKVVTILLCYRFLKKENKNIFPKPVQAIIINKFMSYANAERIRDYLLTEITLLNLNYLDGKEEFSEGTKETMHFVKNDLLMWFDNETSKL